MNVIVDNAGKTDFVSTLSICYNELIERQKALRPLLDNSAVIVAGYGTKGRDLALFLRECRGKDVLVLDRASDGIKRAKDDGFRTIDKLFLEKHPSIGVVVAACQDQVAQARVYPTRYVLFEEAAYFFEKPYHFHNTCDYPNWIIDNANILSELYLSLEAQAQSDLLRDLSFRTSLSPNKLQATRMPVSGMWFDIPKRFGARDYNSYLDVGAFDGDSLSAASRWLQFQQATAIEANPVFRSKIMECAAFFRELEVFTCAAWSCNSTLSFYEDALGMMAVEEVASGSVRAEALDTICSGPFDFIKMDIEGSEEKALIGASRLLSHGPDLALAAYHRPSDILDLYNLVCDNGYSQKNFRFFIKHYSDCLDDTIIYFLRNKWED